MMLETLPHHISGVDTAAQVSIWKDPHAILNTNPPSPFLSRNTQTLQDMHHAPDLVQTFKEDLFWNPALGEAKSLLKRGQIDDYGARTTHIAEPHRSWHKNGGHLRASVSDCSSAVQQMGFGHMGNMDHPELANRLSHLLEKSVQENNQSAGEEIEQLVLDKALMMDTVSAISLIRMHTTNGNLYLANLVFRKLQSPCASAWNAVILAHVRLGESNQAMELYHEMLTSGVQPNGPLYVTVLKACSDVSSLGITMQVHGDLVADGFESDIYVGSTLIGVYVKHHELGVARTLFNRLPNRNVVTWSTLIAGYTEHGQVEAALLCSKEMQQEGIQPNEVTFVSLLKACSSVAAREQGKWVHDQVIERGLDAEPFIGSSLVDMYSKCGNLENALMVFERLPHKDLVAWSALIQGYAQNKQGQEALQLFRRMVQRGLDPDRVTYISVIQACSSIVALEYGSSLHACIIDRGYEADARIGSTLISMYANCGTLEKASTLLQRLPVKNVVTWSAMIAGCALQSNFSLALRIFARMQEVGLEPNDVTFISLFSACGHAGQVDVACRHFKSMRQDYRMDPTLEHYNVMVDVLGRAGLLNEAEDLMESVPFKLDIIGWTSLLGSCYSYNYVDLGKRCFDRVLDNGGCATAYMWMSNIYANAGMRKEAARIRKMRRVSSTWKKPANAFIEVGNQVHSFVVGDDSHPQSDDIYAKLNSLSSRMRDQGYQRANTRLGTKSNLSESREDVNCGHSEKLAIAFGLISTPEGTTIRVGKNLRVCRDCHHTANFISKVELREIIVSDSYRVHCFKDGSCSCNES